MEVHGAWMPTFGTPTLERINPPRRPDQWVENDRVHKNLTYNPMCDTRDSYLREFEDTTQHQNQGAEEWHSESCLWGGDPSVDLLAYHYKHYKENRVREMRGGEEDGRGSGYEQRDRVVKIYWEGYMLSMTCFCKADCCNRFSCSFSCTRRSSSVKMVICVDLRCWMCWTAIKVSTC